ncbi:MAG: DUF4386 domain-containing protein [Gammaproteobacteria bacterium]|nr:DUF4386 domain-containing protein [Gammaproteobacteria bacterium]
MTKVDNIKVKARIAGFFYVLTTITGMLAITIGDKLFESGDAAATAANVLAHDAWVWIGPAINLVSVACYIVVTALLYELFKPVNRSVSLIAAFFSLAGCTIGAASEVFDLAPSLVLAGTAYGGTFGPEQLQALAYTFFRLNGVAFNIAMVFFGFYCVLIGYLAFRSTFLPRAVGVLMVIAGLCWLTFLSPPLHHALSAYTGITGLVGEGVFELWLLIMGVNTSKWQSVSARRHHNPEQPPLSETI